MSKGLLRDMSPEEIAICRRVEDEVYATIEIATDDEDYGPAGMGALSAIARIVWECRPDDAGPEWVADMLRTAGLACAVAIDEAERGGRA